MIYIAFVPWVLFSVITTHVGVVPGAWAAVVAGTAIALWSTVRGRPKLLEWAAACLFGVLTAVAVLQPGDDSFVSRYARAFAAGGLALIAFGSLLFVPFTEQYAREQAPREVWHTPAFRSINRQLTVMWGAAFVLMIPAHIAAGVIDTHRANVWLNWVVPIVLIIIVVKRTAAVTATAKSGGASAAITSGR